MSLIILFIFINLFFVTTYLTSEFFLLELIGSQRGYQPCTIYFGEGKEQTVAKNLTNSRLFQ